MTKIIKGTIVDRVKSIDELSECSPNLCRTVVQAYLDLMTNTLIEGKAIRFKNVGKLVPYLKKGGRPVRNLKTKETMPMPDRLTVSFTVGTLSMGNREGIEVLSETDMIKALADNEQLLNAVLRSAFSRRSDPKAVLGATVILRKLADGTVRSFNALFQEAREKELPIELRGMGRFKNHRPMRDGEQLVVNPATGERLVKTGKDAVIRTSFKESVALRRALDEKLANA